MHEIYVAPELWASSLFPEGVIEKWLLADGAPVKAGRAVVAVRVEDALHEIIAPADGRLAADVKAGSVVDPGMVIGRIVP